MAVWQKGVLHYREVISGRQGEARNVSLPFSRWGVGFVSYALPFGGFRSAHPWLWKFLICFLAVALVIFFIFAGVAGAFAFAAFLPAGLSLAAIGPALLVVGVVAAGVYVGTHMDDIAHSINTSWNNVTSYYNSLSANVKAKFEAAGASWNYEAVGNQEVEFDTEMQAAVSGFLRETVTLSTENSFQTVAPLVNNSNYQTGAFLTADYVNQTWALQFIIEAGNPNAGTYRLVPVQSIWNPETLSVSGGIAYKWALLQQDGTWKVLDAIATSYGTTRYISVVSFQNYGSWFTNIWWYGAGTDQAIFGSLASAMAQYRQIVENRLRVNITAADWVDVAFPVWEWPQGKTKVAVPPGVITGNPSAVSVSISSAQADVIGEVTTADPGAPDYNPPTTGSLNWGPLLLAGQLVKEKFPFSIPWDLKNQLNVFNVAPQAPVVDVDIPNFIKLGGMTIPLDFTLDLTRFDTIALITRWFVTLLVDIGFILMIRRLMPE